MQDKPGGSQTGLDRFCPDIFGLVLDLAWFFLDGHS